jgi:hypothetical protein
MDDLCKVFQCQVGAMSFFDDDGNESDRMDGYTVELFIPTANRADVDRNDTKRREITAAIDAAISVVED